MTVNGGQPINLSPLVERATLTDRAAALFDRALAWLCGKLTRALTTRGDDSPGVV